MRRLLTAAVVFGACAAMPAGASSPDAWAEYRAELTEACLNASGFTAPKPHTGIIMFDDSVGYDALVVEGAYPQAHMAGQTGMVLCLYNKAAKTAAVSEFNHAP